MKRIILASIATAALAAVCGIRIAAQAGTYTFVTLAGVPGTTPLWFTHAIAAAPDGTLVIPDSSHFVLRRVTPSGQSSVIAGQVDQCCIVDGPAASAKFSFTYGVAVAPDGTIYVSHGLDNVVRRVSTDGTVATVAGLAGISNAGSADGTGAAARFSSPMDLQIAPDGDVFVADAGNKTIRKMTPGGTVTTIAGSAGVSGSTDGVGTAARFTSLAGLAVTPDGSLYISDNATIRRMAPDGTVTTVAGSPGQFGSVDGTGSAARLGAKRMASDASGNLYFTEGCTIRKMTPAAVVTTVAGSSTDCSTSRDGTGSAARLQNPVGITVDAAGTIWFVEMTSSGPSPNLTGATFLRSMTPGGTITTVLGAAGGPNVIDGTGPAASFAAPRGAAYSKGLVYETDAMLLRTVNAAGVVKRMAQMIDVTRAVAVDGAGAAYVTVGCGVAKAAPDGTVTTLAGTPLSIGPGACGSADGSATAARFNVPAGIAVNGAGTTVFVADTGNSTVRMIANGTTTTILGAAGQAGSADGFGVASRFSGPTGLVLDSGGNLFVADTGNHTIRRVTAAGDVTTFAGAAGSAGSTDGTGAAARFNAPMGLALDASGNLYVADSGNATIRKVTAAGVVTTIAGIAGKPGVANGLPAETRFSSPAGIAIDEGGTLYVADMGSHTIRQGLIDVVAPAITAHPSPASVVGGTTVQFTAAATGNPSPAFQWEVSTNGGATWTTLNEAAPYSGTRSPVLTITSTPGSLNGRSYRASAANPAGSAATNAASLTVNAIFGSPAALRFAAAKAGADGAITASTPPQMIAVAFTAATSTWTAAADQPWLQITGSSGSGPGAFTVAIVNPNNVIGGSTALSATITMTAGSGLVAAIPVTLTVDLTNPANAPFGSFDTPANNATGVQGSIAVTGWALDDIGVERVEIWRDRANGEPTSVYTGSGPGNGKIFVGFASFVSGARPDVEAAYPTRPNAQRAGWGYLLLTYGLWNQPNSVTYQLYAYAFDVDGTMFTTLGTKRIFVDNAAATKPFGAIDTPGQGATASGVVQNFGWALTPGSTCSIANPDVRVSIDSGALTPVVYGDARSDIASAFAGYTNSAAAGGHYALDTTLIADGVHTIGWYVTDSCGRAEGIGSRFFTVANGGSSLVAAPASAGTPALKPAATAPVVRSRVVRVGQNERFELPLPGDEPYRAGPLPIGSSFDVATNTFYWQPAAGFLGAYDLQFFPAEAGSHMSPVNLRVVVGPPIRMVVDTPKAGTVLAASGFTVAGWAVDLGSVEGAGIDTLHVWAYPVSGAPPVFVGAAQSGGARPDVAKLYGASFGDAGFTLTGALAPGTYDLVVFAHSATTNTFAGAETVRVIVR